MKRQLLIVVIFIASLVAIWIYLIKREYATVQPRGDTLVEHLASFPDPQERRLITVNGREYLVLIGEPQSFPRFPSGPTVYVFDELGRLIDWSSDLGDDGDFNSRWPNVFEGRIISTDEMLKWPKSKE